MVRITIVLIIAMLAMETMASPLNLEVSIKGVQNGNTTEQLDGACVPEGRRCYRHVECCKGLICRWGRNPEFPGSEFSSLDSESETLQLTSTIPRPIPSLVPSSITRPSPRPRRVLDRETRVFETDSLISSI